MVRMVPTILPALTLLDKGTKVGVAGKRSAEQPCLAASIKGRSIPGYPVQQLCLFLGPPVPATSLRQRLRQPLVADNIHIASPPAAEFRCARLADNLGS